MLTSKTALLRAIADGLVPGISAPVRVLLLGQVQEDEDKDRDATASSSPDETVLEHVLRSDKLRERRLYEARRLSEAMDNIDDPTAMLKAYRELTHERLEREVEEAKLKASKTSGVRGLGARKALTTLEEELATASSRLDHIHISNGLDDEDSTTIKEETQKAIDMLADIQASLTSVHYFPLITHLTHTNNPPDGRLRRGSKSPSSPPRHRLFSLPHNPTPLPPLRRLENPLQSRISTMPTNRPPPPRRTHKFPRLAFYNLVGKLHTGSRPKHYGDNGDPRSRLCRWCGG